MVKTTAAKRVPNQSPAPEARLAVWEAICDAAEALDGQCAIYRSAKASSPQRLTFETSVFDLPTWKLVEALSLLSILRRAERVVDRQVFNIFGRTGPIRFVENGFDRFLWAQPSLSGHESALIGRPDLLVTSTPDPPSSATTLRIIECKCRATLAAPDIRAEFGKAYDLRVTSYLIWSFNTPPTRLVQGARGLGLNLETLAFETESAEEWIREPQALAAHVSRTLDAVRRRASFCQGSTSDRRGCVSENGWGVGNGGGINLY